MCGGAVRSLGGLCVARVETRSSRAQFSIIDNPRAPVQNARPSFLTDPEGTSLEQASRP